MWSNWVWVVGTALWFPGGRAQTKGGRPGQELGLVREGGDLGHCTSWEDSQRSRGQEGGRPQPRTWAQVLGAAGATSSPKRSPARRLKQRFRKPFQPRRRPRRPG